MKNSDVTGNHEPNQETRFQLADAGTDSVASSHHLTGEESDFQRRKRLQQMTIASIHSFSARGRLSRDEVHRRENG